MLASRPPLGWNSWNTFGDKISDPLIREMADLMVERGYLDAGYEYLVIDDCWSLRERDASGRLVPDPVKFPDGMKAVADYVHSKGLKFGMWTRKPSPPGAWISLNMISAISRRPGTAAPATRPWPWP